MKKLLLTVCAVIAIASAHAQTTVLCENFNTYDSLTANANYGGWSLTYFTQFSYYTSTQSSGASGPNSYKFGVDSATAISPNINTATHINFWMKGNPPSSGNMSASTFYVYETNNGTNWNLIATIFPVPTTGGIRQYALSAGTTQVKFFYDKDSGNVAFDDFCSTIGPVGVNAVEKEVYLNVYPSPARGQVNLICSPAINRNAEITIINMIGNEMKDISIIKETPERFSIDMKGRQPGVYFVKIKTEKGVMTKRFTLNP